LQTITSREIDPAESCVVTVGALNAGDAENVISSHAELKLNVRSFNPEVRGRVLAGIKRIVVAESMASNAPAPPEIEATSSFPLTSNDHQVTEKLEETFSKHFPPSPHGYTREIDRAFGSEDFGLLGSMIDRPYCYFIYGGVDPEVWDEAEKKGTLQESIPVNHSPFFAPVIQPTLKVGVEGYAAAALTWLAK
jgi:metal-dependent amidase/aminoacylase/carboxypeptidase family protein